MQPEPTNEMYLWIGAVTFVFFIAIVLFERWYDKKVRKPVDEDLFNEEDVFK